MKSRLFILTCSILFITSAAHAQVSFGVQTGASVFYIKNTTDESFSYSGYTRQELPIIGYYAALAVDIPIKNNFSIQSELSIIRKGKGTKIEVTEMNFFAELPGKWRYESRFEYIEIPVLAKYHLHFNEKIGLDLGFGISTGYLREETYWQKEKSEKSTSIDREISNEYKFGRKINRWDISPLLDISMPLNIGMGNMNFGYRLSFDTSDYFAYENKSIERLKPMLYNWGMIFYVGYSLNKGDFKKEK